MKRLLLPFLLLTLSPLNLYAGQMAAPCLKQVRGRWKIQKEQCVQMSKATYEKYMKALRTLKYYKKTYEPAAETIKTKYKALDKQWKASMANWKQQVAVSQKMSAEYKKMAQTWRQAFFKLKDQKAPSRSWTRSPILWFSVGVVATAAAVGLGYGLSQWALPHK